MFMGPIKLAFKFSGPSHGNISNGKMFILEGNRVQFDPVFGTIIAAGDLCFAEETLPICFEL